MEKYALMMAVDWLGGQAATGRLLGVDQPRVWHWIHTQKRVPAEYAIALEKATKGLVTRYQLRPDIYPREDDAA